MPDSSMDLDSGNQTIELFLSFQNPHLPHDQIVPYGKVYAYSFHQNMQAVHLLIGFLHWYNEDHPSVRYNLLQNPGVSLHFHADINHKLTALYIMQDFLLL